MDFTVMDMALGAIGGILKRPIGSLFIDDIEGIPGLGKIYNDLFAGYYATVDYIVTDIENRVNRTKADGDPVVGSVCDKVMKEIRKEFHYIELIAEKNYIEYIKEVSSKLE